VDDQIGKIRFEQKRVDILLGVDLVRLSAKGQITDAVIVAGDSDFLPAIEAAKGDGILIRLFHGCRPHDALLLVADERAQIDREFIDRIRRRPAERRDPNSNGRLEMSPDRSRLRLTPGHQPSIPGGPGTNYPCRRPGPDG
jgi:hypothetical protein